MKVLPGANTSRLYVQAYPGITFPDGPDVLLFHTTETTGLPWYDGGRGAPNATFDVKRRQVFQHFWNDMSSRALENRVGGVDTNHARVWQVEIVGYSDRAIARSIGRDDLWVGNFTEADLEWIARQLAPLVEAFPIPFRLSPRFTRNPVYGLSAPQRMSFDEWRAFSGWTYHAACPENVHWDSGALNIPHIMVLVQAIIAPAPTPPPTPIAPQGDDMAFTVDRNGHWYLVMPEAGRQGDLVAMTIYGEDQAKGFPHIKIDNDISWTDFCRYVRVDHDSSFTGQWPPSPSDNTDRVVAAVTPKEE